MTDRPNIFWFMSEDAPILNTAYGDRHATTPTIQRIAEEGVVFEHAFATSPVCAPSRFGVISGMYAETCGPAHQMRADAPFPDSVRTFAELAKDAGYYCTNNWKTDYNAMIDANEVWHESSQQAHWRNRPDGMPFLHFFNDFATHESAVFQSPVTTVQPDDVEVPSYLPDTPEVRYDIARYYTAINQMDANFGELVGQLDEDGLLDDTIIIHTSDHGSVIVRSKRFCYDTGLRIPFIARFPEKYRHLSPWGPGRRVSTAVSQIDLPPSVLSLIGVEIPDTMQGTAMFGDAAEPLRGLAFSGRNRMDERYDFVRTVRDEQYRYVRNYAPHRPWAQYQSFAWLARNYQVFEIEHRAGRLNDKGERYWGEKPAEELYDTFADPEETENLAGEPAHSERIARYRELLTEHMVAINDNGFIPEGSPIEGFDESRRPGAYPLRDVIALADAAIERDPTNVEQFATALSDGNEVIRWWAANGLVMLEEQAAPARDALAVALHDESPRVRVVAAEAWSWFAVDEAVAVLGELCQPDQDWRVRVQAINSLTCLPALPAAVGDAIATSIDDDLVEVREAAKYLDRIVRDDHDPSVPVFDFERFVAAVTAGRGVVSRA